MEVIYLNSLDIPHGGRSVTKILCSRFVKKRPALFRILHKIGDDREVSLTWHSPTLFSTGCVIPHKVGVSFIGRFQLKFFLKAKTSLPLRPLHLGRAFWAPWRRSYTHGYLHLHRALQQTWLVALLLWTFRGTIPPAPLDTVFLFSKIFQIDGKRWKNGTNPVLHGFMVNSETVYVFKKKSRARIVVSLV